MLVRMLQIQPLRPCFDIKDTKKPGSRLESRKKKSRISYPGFDNPPSWATSFGLISISHYCYDSFMSCWGEGSR